MATTGGGRDWNAAAVKMYGLLKQTKNISHNCQISSDAGADGFILSSNPGLREVSQTKMPH